MSKVRVRSSVNLTRNNSFTMEGQKMVTQSNDFEALDDLHLDLVRSSDPG